MKKPQIKAIIFDIGGVLVLGEKLTLFKGHDYSKNVHQFMAKHFRVSLTKWLSSLAAIRKSVKKPLGKEHVAQLAKKLDTTTLNLEKLFFKAYKRVFKDNKELYSFAFQLKKKAYKIAILSNQWYVPKKAVISKKNLRKFDNVVISCDVGVRKPYPDIYRIMLKRLNLLAKNCVFIDNLQRNLAPAKKLGIHTILFKNNKQVFRDLKDLGVKI
jgi:epoxide hydrolase-like predicted phosphatase